MGVLDIIFPKYCVNCRKSGSYVCSDCFSYLSFDVKTICLVCGGGSINSLTHPGCLDRYAIDGSFSSIRYNPIAKKLLYKFKYKPYLSDLQKFLVDLMFESLIQNEEFNKILKQNPVIVFVPLFKSKLKSRGYNQVELLANGLGKKLVLQVQNILFRKRQTKPQFGLKKRERKENVQGAFNVQKNATELLKNRTILLADDVLTTGSTLLECANVLKREGSKKVYGVTLAID